MPSCRIAWDVSMMELSYTGKYIVGGLSIAVAAVATTFSGLFIKWGLDDQRNQPNIVLRKAAFFWIEIEKDIYQIGVVIRLQNLGGKPYPVRGVALNATELKILGRGQSYLRREPFLTGARAEVTDENFMEAKSEASFKMLLPLKFPATIEHPPPPEIEFVGQWALILQKEEYPVQPELFGTFDRTISLDEWASLLNESSTISIGDISFDKPAPIVSAETPVSDFILFNPDRSATFHVRGFDQTPYARADAGAMVYVRGRGTPPLDGGWVVLGHSYEDVWADAQKRALYNAIFPPAPDGSPRRVGVFAQ